jgi:hypothetical protein
LSKTTSICNCVPIVLSAWWRIGIQYRILFEHVQTVMSLAWCINIFYA